MKISTYKLKIRFKNVSVWEAVEMDIPIMKVLETGILPLGEMNTGMEVEDPILDEEVDIYDSDEWRSKLFSPMQFEFRKKDGSEHHVNGAVTSNSFSSLAEFALHSYIPQTNDESSFNSLRLDLDEGRIDAESFRSQFEKRMKHYNDNCYSRPFFKIDNISDFQFRNSSNGADLLINKVERDGAITVCAEMSSEFGGYKVPRRVFIIRTKKILASWDGWCMRIHKKFSEIPRTIWNLIEKQGSVLTGNGEATTPLLDMETHFLVRVPNESEIKKVKAPGKKPSGELFTRPWFMIDTRRAIVLPSQDGNGKIPVITRPSDALFILRRMTGRGAYVPGIRPCVASDAPSAEQMGGGEVFLAGCLPQQRNKPYEKR